MSDFKSKHTFEERKRNSESIMSKFPDKIPIVINCHDKIDIDRSKFLAPKEITTGKFMFEVKKRITNLTEREAVFFMVNNKMLPVTAEMLNVYTENKDEDGFLYMTLVKESCFGYKN